MNKILIALVALFPLAFADEMPEGSVQRETVRAILGELGDFGVICPAEMDVPTVQIYCSLSLGDAENFPGAFDVAAFHAGDKLEAIDQAWIFHTNGRYERSYALEGGTLRVVLDSTEGRVPNVFMAYLP